MVCLLTIKYGERVVTSLPLNFWFSYSVFVLYVYVYLFIVILYILYRHMLYVSAYTVCLLCQVYCEFPFHFHNVGLQYSYFYSYLYCAWLVILSFLFTPGPQRIPSLRHMANKSDSECVISEVTACKVTEPVHQSSVSCRHDGGNRVEEAWSEREPVNDIRLRPGVSRQTWRQV